MELPRDFYNYAILSELGRGTTGVVYLARHTILNRPVAIKFPHKGTEAEQIVGNRQFLDGECRILASLTHPGIVSPYEVAETEDGRLYCVREYIEGETLKTLARAKAFDLGRGLEAVSQVARAIQFVHENGSAHRNLRASNILIRRDGRPVLIGFGWAGPLTGSPYLAPHADGTPAVVDVRGLQELLRWLAATLGQPLTPRLSRLCEPGTVESPAAFADAVVVAE